MAISKVIYGGRTLIDLTNDTLTPDKLLQGYTAHGADGEPIEGTCAFDVDSSAATAAQAEVLKDRTFAKGGKVLSGTMPNNGAKQLKIKAKTDKLQIVQGYHDGSGFAELDDTEKAKLIAENIRQGVTLLGVNGSMTGTEDMVSQAKEVTPGTEQQTVLPDEGFNALTQVTVKAVPYTETENAAGGTTVTIC